MKLNIKKVDKVSRKLKMKSRKERLDESLTREMLFSSKKTKDKQKSILNFKPVSWGKRTTKLSEEVDSILYG